VFYEQMGKTCSTTEEMKNVNKSLVTKPEGKRSLKIQA
jgi:hypothetical protein